MLQSALVSETSLSHLDPRKCSILFLHLQGGRIRSSSVALRVLYPLQALTDNLSRIFYASFGMLAVMADRQILAWTLQKTPHDEILEDSIAHRKMY